MDRAELEKILPHREPMLLLDEAELQEDAQGNCCAVGRSRVRGDEFFLQGHFPGNPVVPGVIQCEMLAQTCAVLLAGEAAEKTPYYTSLDKVRFKRPVRPGEELQFHCMLTKVKKPFYFAQGKGTVDGVVCVQAEFSFAIVD